jgi:L-lactate dehydrogenase complex protein LldG
MSDAREEVLARVRGALGDASAVTSLPRGYRTRGEHAPGSTEALEQLADRLEDYRARVLRVPAGDEVIGDAIAAALSELGIREAIAAPGVPADWLRGVPRARTDDGSTTARELDRASAVVTGSVTAVAETGTIVLDGSPLCGRRAITLVPDVHVCVVLASDVVQTVPEGLRRVDPTRPLTLVSGPSATSDIELSRVEGVHGPRTLVVVLAG